MTVGLLPRWPLYSVSFLQTTPQALASWSLNFVASLNYLSPRDTTGFSLMESQLCSYTSDTHGDVKEPEE
jgi:hypothetical protein